MGGRDDMTAGSGKLLLADHTVFDLTEMLSEIIGGVVWALKTIDYPHAELHAGEAFALSALDVDLDTADELAIVFTTPDTAKWLHCVVSGSNSSASQLEILEAPTITVDTGSDMTPVNRDRNSANESGVLSIETVPVANRTTLNPTIAADGTVIHVESMGTGKDKGASGSRGAQEFVLKRDTTYAFRITGLADNGLASIEVTWYEHTNR